jgi:hypothetical protein
MERSSIQQKFIDDQIAAALIRANLNHNGPLRQTLSDEAVIVGPASQGYLRVRDNRGELVSVETRIEQMRAEPAFSAHFPNPPKIGFGEGDKIRENFERIGLGEVQVVK